MRIKELKLKNVGVFQNEHTLKFKKRTQKNKAEIHIFTGENGSGKSTILHALASVFNHTQQDEVCKFTNNNLHLRMERGKEKSSISITTDLCSKEQLIAYKCPGMAQHLHIENNCEALKTYGVQLSERWSKDYEHSFALFAYPSHHLSTFKETPGTNNENPLHQSLEFEKDKNYAHNIQVWLRELILKRTFKEKELSLLNTSKKNNSKTNEYEDVLNHISTFFSKIMEQEVDFVLDEDSRYNTVRFHFKASNKKLPFEVLAEGIKCLLSWVIDICYRLDHMKWKKNLPLLQRPFILFLDEADAHLHIRWQRLLLPFVEDLFPKAQIFLSTHSPFITNSVDGASIHQLNFNRLEGTSSIKPVKESTTTLSVDELLGEVYGINPIEEYGLATEKDIEIFRTQRDLALKKDPSFDKEAFLKLAKTLALKSNGDLRGNILFELKQLSKNLNESFEL